MREKALSLISAMIETQTRLDILNNASRDIYGDFYPHQSIAADAIYWRIVDLLNEALGNEADYFLHDCQSMSGGGSVSIGSKTWPLKSVDDFRRYLDEKDLI